MLWLVVGEYVVLLFSFGIIGIGLFVVLVLVGLVGYVVVEVVGWCDSFDFKFECGEGCGFYLVIVVVMLGGVVLCFVLMDLVC